MKAPPLERTSAAKAGWLIILLTVGWLVFILMPGPPRKPPTPPATIPVPATSLTRAGLPEYTDWMGLPEIFEVWASRAEWKDGRTRFAYWHPVMKNYSYYFEATRVEGGYRFREIAEPREPGHYWDESLGEECPIRFYRTAPVSEMKTPAPLSSPAGTGQRPDRLSIEIPMPKSSVAPANPPPKP